MKKPRRNFTKRHQLRRQGALLLGFCCAGTWTLPAAEEAGDNGTAENAETEEAAPEPEFGQWRGGGLDYYNWMDLSVGGAIVSGDEIEFQHRHHTVDGPYGGLETFHWEKFVGDNGIFLMDGRAMLLNNDYSVRLRLNDTEKGYIRAGYRQFRTWYNGIGGFHPPGDLWFPLNDRDLHLDRGEFWIETGLTLPDWPEFSVRYSHSFRDGRKDSTSWGVSNRAGGRGISASFWDIDEERNTVEGKVKDTFGNTDMELRARYEAVNLDNSLNIRQYPTEAAERYLTDKDGQRTDLFSAHAFTETRFTDDILFTSGWLYSNLDTDITGSRIYGTGYNSVYDPAFFRPPDYVGLTGGSQLRQYVMSLNLQYAITKDLLLMPSFRAEKQGIDSNSLALADPTDDSYIAADSESGLVDLSGRLELRYQGLKKWVFFVRGDWTGSNGDLEERQAFLETGDLTFTRDTDIDRLTQKYTATARYYPIRQLSFAGQYYHKIHEYDYSHSRDSTDNTSFNRYPAFLTDQDFTTDDVNFRTTWRPHSRVTIVGRYDFQISTVDTRGAGLSEVESAEITSHIFSGNITWNPLNRLYFGGTFNYVMDQTESHANRAPSPTRLVLESENDYWNAVFTTGYALSNRTDVEAQYIFYRADNYIDNSDKSVPYGSGYEEHGITAGIIHRIRENIRVSLKYGFFTLHDDLTGGKTDYDAHLVSATMQYRF